MKKIYCFLAVVLYISTLKAQDASTLLSSPLTLQVKKGDSVSANFKFLRTTSRSKSIPGIVPFITTNSIAEPKLSTRVTESATHKRPVLSFGAIVIPSIFKRDRSKVSFILIRQYNTSGILRSESSHKLSTSGEDFSMSLTLISEDGYLVISSKQKTVFGTIDAKVKLFRKIASTVPFPSFEDKTIGPRVPSKPQQPKVHNVCTYYYWQTFMNGELIGSDLIGISCESGVEGEGRSGGGGGGGGFSLTQDEVTCVSCKRRAKAARDAALRNKKILVTAELLGCQGVTAGTFVSINTAALPAQALNAVFPGITAAAIEVVAAVGALTADIGCMSWAVLTFDEQQKEIEAEYENRIMGCGDCPFTP